MTTSVQYLIWEQRAYISADGRLMCQIEECYEYVSGIFMDGQIIMFLGEI